MKNDTAATAMTQLENLAEDAKALLAATADVAEDKVIEARKRLRVALQTGRKYWNSTRVKAVDGAKVTDRTIRTNPYCSLGVAVSVGALLGFVLGRRE